MRLKREKNKKVLIIGGCGYIGSRLFLFLKNKNYSVDTVDLEWFGNYVNPKNIKVDYGKLKKDFLNKYEVIILLAGHSNYFMCESNPKTAFKNNVVNFINLLHNLSDQIFIYASSFLVYEKIGSRNAKENSELHLPETHYDLTKRTIDYYAQLSKVRYYGLRFGTVGGYSPNLRTDLMINSMYHSAITNNSISVYNPQNYRPVLGINDLCRAINRIITKKTNPGIYNLASYNLTLAEIAKRVSRELGGVQIKKVPSFPFPLQSYAMSTKKFEETFDFDFRDSVESMVRSLKKTYSQLPKSVRK